MNTQVCQRVVTLFLLTLFASSCNLDTKKATDNDISFDSLQVEKSYHLLENPENPHCNLQINFIFPDDFDNKDVLKKMQLSFVETFYGEDYADRSPQEATTQFTTDYLTSYKELEDEFKTELTQENETPIGSWFSYYQLLSNEITYNKQDILSYTIQFENYTGGAHGSHSIIHQSIDLKTGSVITEDDIFNEGFEEDLSALLVNYIAQQNNVEQVKELENIGFFSIEEIFPNGNFAVNENGITYTFNEYEIAAYVVGATEVYLAYKEIQHLLKTESPIAHLVF